jgi:hypothetical protein
MSGRAQRHIDLFGAARLTAKALSDRVRSSLRVFRFVTFRDG